MDLHHPILREFPEHREIIRRLKGSDDHFRKMFDEYHRLDDAVYRIEEEIDFATDQEIDELKLRRAKLKDYIYHLVRHAPPSCPTCEGTRRGRVTHQVVDIIFQFGAAQFELVNLLVGCEINFLLDA